MQLNDITVFFRGQDGVRQCLLVLRPEQRRRVERPCPRIVTVILSFQRYKVNHILFSVRNVENFDSSRLVHFICNSSQDRQQRRHHFHRNVKYKNACVVTDCAKRFDWCCQRVTLKMYWSGPVRKLCQIIFYTIRVWQLHTIHLWYVPYAYSIKYAYGS